MNESTESSVNITERLLSYHHRLEARSTAELNLIVIHCSELPTLEMAREFGERITLPESGTGFSGHYYVDRDGSIYRYVTDDRMARHVIGYNEHSIGIEIVNSGRYPNWFHSQHQQCTEPYTTDQIEALKRLLRYLQLRHPSIVTLARHSDLDTQTIPAEDDPSLFIRRKIDPGPLFPWDDLFRWWLNL